MKPDQSRPEKLGQAQAVDPVIVRVCDHEPRQTEEKVDGQEAVTDEIVAAIRRDNFREVENNYRKGCHSPKTVEQLEVLALSMSHS